MCFIAVLLYIYKHDTSMHSVFTISGIAVYLNIHVVYLSYVISNQPIMSQQYCKSVILNYWAKTQYWASERNLVCCNAKLRPNGCFFVNLKTSYFVSHHIYLSLYINIYLLVWCDCYNSSVSVSFFHFLSFCVHYGIDLDIFHIFYTIIGGP